MAPLLGLTCRERRSRLDASLRDRAKLRLSSAEVTSLPNLTMAATLTIRDETATGETLRAWSLEFPAERITVRELIQRRVQEEVDDYNLSQSDVFVGLVQPVDAERALNGFKLRKKRQIDWNQQFDKALEAFQRNRVVVLIGDRQADSLDEHIDITPGTEVTFLRLVPLVGG